MMKDVIILGVDIHAIEMGHIIERAGRYHLLGYIMQDGFSGSMGIGDLFGSFPILGDKNDLDKYPDVGFIPMHVWKDMDAAGAASAACVEQWISLIDPAAFVSLTANIGKGCVVYPNCFIGANAKLGSKIFMLSGAIVNHDCDISDNVTITSGVMLAGGVKVGKGAYLGQGCNVRQNLVVGENAMVGMGAVVTKDIPANATYIGNPAKPYASRAR